MRILLVIASLVFFSSCSTVKKLITKTNTQVDSTSGHVRDTATKTTTIQDQKDLQLSDLDITVVYSDKDSIKAEDYFSKPEIQTLHDVVKSISGNRVPTSVKIHIGNLSDSGKKISTEVVATSHTVDTTALKKNVSVSVRDVKKVRAPLWLTLGAIGIGLAVLVYAAYRIKQKYFPLV